MPILQQLLDHLSVGLEQLVGFVPHAAKRPAGCSHAGTGRPGCCAPVLLSPGPSDPGSPSMKVSGLVLH